MYVHACARACQAGSYARTEELEAVPGEGAGAGRQVAVAVVDGRLQRAAADEEGGAHLHHPVHQLRAHVGAELLGVWVSCWGVSY